MQEAGGDYAWRSYEVQTDDGYILRMFRITGSRGESNERAEKGPLLLIHGFASDSITWFDRTDQEALAVGSQLHEEGYDVWMANMRGSRRSRRHITEDPDDSDDEFWEFDQADMAEGDIKAMVENIKL